MQLIDVILPLKIQNSYTYAVPIETECPLPGTRVLVPLGRKQITGIVLGLHEEALPEGLEGKIRPIITLLDEGKPLVSSAQLTFWQWLASYYMCTLGEVMAAALPSGIIDDDYTAKTATFVRLHEGVDAQQKMEELRKRAPKQARVLEQLMQLQTIHPEVEKRLLVEMSGESTAIVRALTEKNILDEIERNISRLHPYTGPVKGPSELSEAQQQAVVELHRQWETHDVNLLHGVTSSGKTEVYIHLINEQLATGHSVLYMVPEIALTTQLTQRLRVVFGDRLLVYHSRFSDAERVEVYHAVADKTGPCVIIGARSAIFLPPENMGLVILDEEHEPSYKQQDPAPRYHARSAAIMLAHLMGAKVLLGTATPSIESYRNAITGKYGLVRLTTRYAGLLLPEIELINLERQYHRKEMYGHFSDPLVDKMREELQKGKQIILFQNRRGYAPMLQCTGCGKPPRCVNCDVALTVHLQAREMRCHHCGYSMAIPTHCPSCGGELKIRGFGTERLEDELHTYFPEARVLRMDLDTTRQKDAYQDIINRFSRHECDILVGTQMVTKGLHFDDVSLVAVLNADPMLNSPDFRAYERTFQMLEQVAGRAGRTGQQGKVMIQTFEPDNEVLKQVVAHDYEPFYQQQEEERRMFHYPPFHRQIRIVLRHRDNQHVGAAADWLQQRLRQVFGERMGAVVTPGISRVQNQYVRSLMLTIEAEANIRKAKSLLQQQIQVWQQLEISKGCTLVVDVDPM